MEIWEAIPDYEGLYEVSNYGRVRSILFRNRQKVYKRNKILSMCNNGTGYYVVNLYRDGKGKVFLVHRLTAMAFIPNPNNYPQVNHKDENKKNNHIENLEWCDEKYNNRYGTRNFRETVTKQKKYGIPVVQKDINGNVICVYSCIREANRKTNIGRKEISRVCKGIYTQAGGYRWEYVR